MRIGDQVRVMSIPGDLPEGDLKTRTRFEKCVGHSFPIAGFHGLELHVGGVLGKEPFTDSIWLEPEYVELEQSQS